jgi:hypothetical protein
MKRPRRRALFSAAMRRPLALSLLSLLLLVPTAAAGEPPAANGPQVSGSGAGDPDVAKDASTADYLKAVELQRKGRFKEAQKAFRDVVAKHPDSIHRDDCEMRSGDNCYMGVVKLKEGGPPARRIDVSVMGDGFQLDEKQLQLEEQWARDCLKVLDSEPAYLEYENYFNYYFVRLVSKDEGVDQIISDEDVQKRQQKGKKKKDPKEFNTALDCKAAGPQKQVMADHDLVYRWLEYANRDAPGCGDDGLVIAFAKFGELGMAELGNGLANCGRPSNSVTVHEFGHAFVGLLDEYAIAPGPPTFPVRAPNATGDKNDIPWKHFLDAKVKGVGIVEGGATFKSGVWRPCVTCSMNSAGAGNGYCPVCREAAVLRIYATVSPIDKVSQDPHAEMKCVDGDASQIVVTPMHPKTHELQCEWYVDRVIDSDPGPQRPRDETTTDGTPTSKNGSSSSTDRSRQRGDTTEFEMPPLGWRADLGQVDGKPADRRFVFPTGKLGRGRWQVTCRVWDKAEWPGLPSSPAVLKDPQHLLEERVSFFVTVAPKK